MPAVSLDFARLSPHLSEPEDVEKVPATALRALNCELVSIVRHCLTPDTCTRLESAPLARELAALARAHVRATRLSSYDAAAAAAGDSTAREARTHAHKATQKPDDGLPDVLSRRDHYCTDDVPSNEDGTLPPLGIVPLAIRSATPPLRQSSR